MCRGHARRSDAARGDGQPRGQMLFRTEEDKAEFKRDKDKALDEMEGFLNRICPASTGKDRQLKLELLELAFGTTSETAIRELLPEAIRDGYRVIVREAEGRSLVHIV